MKQATLLAVLMLTLTACKNVPDVQMVPVPADGSVLNGRYSGALIEQMRLIDALVSGDGSSVFALLQSSGHTLLLDLDPNTGIERRRRAIAAADPIAFSATPDGTLIVVSSQQSVKVSPTSLSILGVLPGATRVSSDGARLLGPGAGSPGQSRRWNTLTGAEIPTVSTEWANPGFDQNLEWVAQDSGRALVNLSTGKQVRVGSLPRACNAYVEARRQTLGFGADAGGFYVLQDDATLHRLDASGAVTGSISLRDGCNNFSIQFSPMVAENGVLRLVYRVYDQGKPTTTQVVWATGQAPTFTALGSGQPLQGGGKNPAYGFTTAQADASSPEVLSAGTRWSVPLQPAQLPASGEFVAAYVDGATYSVRGSLNIGGQGYDAGGQGLTSDTTSPRLMFTQTLCSPTSQSFVAACPRMGWKLDLSARGTPVGTLLGDGLLPSGRQRHEQSGTVRLSDLNTDGLNDTRTFHLTFQPN